MPFTVSNDYKAAVASGTVRLAYALRITCTDGSVFAVTTFTRTITLPELTINFDGGGSITIPETIYRAGVWQEPSDLEQSADVSKVNNWEAAIILGSYITAGHVARRKFKGARWSLIEFIWDDTDLQLLRGRGFVGDVDPSGKRAVFKMKGLEHLLQSDILPVTSPTSKARWGDAELDFFDLDGDTDDGFAARVTGTVDAVDGDYPRRRFRLDDTIDFPANRFSNGTARFTSGDNDGLSLAVMDWDEDTGWFTLGEDAPFDITVGDGVTAQISAPVTIEEWRTYFGSGFGFPGQPGITTIEQANEVTYQ